MVADALVSIGLKTDGNGTKTIKAAHAAWLVVRFLAAAALAALVAAGCFSDVGSVTSAPTPPAIHGYRLSVRDGLMPSIEPLATLSFDVDVRWSWKDRFESYWTGQGFSDPYPTESSKWTHTHMDLRYYGIVETHDEWGVTLPALLFVHWEPGQGHNNSAETIATAYPRGYLFEAATGRSLGTLDLHTGTRTHWRDEGNGPLAPDPLAPAFLFLLEDFFSGEPLGPFVGQRLENDAEPEDRCISREYTWTGGVPSGSLSPGWALRACQGDHSRIPVFASWKGPEFKAYLNHTGMWGELPTLQGVPAQRPAVEAEGWRFSPLPSLSGIPIPPFSGHGQDEPLLKAIEAFAADPSLVALGPRETGYIGAAEVRGGRFAPGLDPPASIPATRVGLDLTDGRRHFVGTAQRAEAAGGAPWVPVGPGSVQSDYLRPTRDSRDVLPTEIVPATHFFSAYAELLPSDLGVVRWHVRQLEAFMPPAGPLVQWRFRSECVSGEPGDWAFLHGDASTGALASEGFAAVCP